MPVGIYYARFKKPESIFEYLDSFITELKSIISNGLCLNGKIYNFVISQIICDAPAKAFMLNIVSTVVLDYMHCLSRGHETFTYFLGKRKKTY
jgi:hypothetical protein